MKSVYVYILKCSDDSFYTGVTSNPQQRIWQHQWDSNPRAFLAKKKPFELVFIECFNDPLTAIAREKQIKRWSHAKKQALIESAWDKLKMLSQCANATHFKNNPGNPD
jgi:putative endonuclease